MVCEEVCCCQPFLKFKCNSVTICILFYGYNWTYLEVVVEVDSEEDLTVVVEVDSEENLTEDLTEDVAVDVSSLRAEVGV